MISVNTHMRTNMRQSKDPDFLPVLRTWWIEINEWIPMNLALAEGTQDPAIDWMHQERSDQVWWYDHDRWQESDFESRLWLVSHLPEFMSVHVTTALYITSQISTDLLHDLEIPGVWLVRVQKT